MADNRAKADKVESAPENQSHTLDVLFANRFVKKKKVSFMFQLGLRCFSCISLGEIKLNGTTVVVQQEYNAIKSTCIAQIN